MTTIYEPNTPAAMMSKRITTMFDATFGGTSAKMTDDVVSNFVAEQLGDVPEQEQFEVLHTVTRHVYERLTPSPMPEMETEPAMEPAMEPEAAQDSGAEADNETEENTENEEDDMPGLISISFCEIKHMLKNGTPDLRICDEIWKYSQENNGKSEVDDEGRTLLHLALRYRSDSQNIIDTILEEFDGIETIPDKADWMPLHYAARYAQTLYPVKELHYWYPDAVLHFNEMGIPPVVSARFGDAPKEIVDFLVTATKRAKAEAKADAKAEAKAAEAEPNTTLSLVVPDHAELAAVLRNAQHYDAFLVALLAICAFFACGILARTLDLT